MVTPLARRRPWNVARQVASLDQLTGGRVTLGVGLGVSSGPEFHDFGGEESDPRVRGDMLDEGLEILRAAWQGTPVRHAGTHYQVDDVTFLPVPVQARVPIWGATERTQRPAGAPGRRAGRGVPDPPEAVGPARAAGQRGPAPARPDWTAMTSSSPAPTPATARPGGRRARPGGCTSCRGAARSSESVAIIEAGPPAG